MGNGGNGVLSLGPESGLRLGLGQSTKCLCTLLIIGNGGDGGLSLSPESGLRQCSGEGVEGAGTLLSIGDASGCGGG